MTRTPKRSWCDWLRSSRTRFVKSSCESVPPSASLRVTLTLLQDQSLQESGVKVETLERRLEATRKQADVITELENDVAKAKKQEKVYEDGIEQLQAEQDVLEAENTRLRKGEGSGDRKVTASGSALSMGDGLGVGTGGFEAAQLAEQVSDATFVGAQLADKTVQVENLRSAVRFLRSENAHFKSKELYNDLHLLPALARRMEPSVPELDPSSPLSSPLSSPSSSTSTDLPVTPTRHALETESKLLFRDIAAFQSSPRIVDISSLGNKPGWQSRKYSPEQQVWAWKVEEKRLERRVERLVERTRALGSGRKA
jgi:dynactin 1